MGRRDSIHVASNEADMTSVEVIAIDAAHPPL